MQRTFMESVVKLRFWEMEKLDTEDNTHTQKGNVLVIFSKLLS